MVGAKDHLALPDHGSESGRVPKSRFELRVGRAERLGDPQAIARRGDRLAVRGAIDASDALDGTWRELVVRRFSRAGHGRVVERSERSPVLDEVPVLNVSPSGPASTCHTQERRKPGDGAAVRAS